MTNKPNRREAYTLLLGSIMACLILKGYNAINTEINGIETQPDFKVQAKEIELQPTDSYIPSSNTIAIINSNTYVSGKIKKRFGYKWKQYAELIAREASFNPSILNPTSGACGLAQALPCSKMACSLDREGIDCQLDWIDEYINSRYGSIEATLEFHNRMNWY